MTRRAFTRTIFVILLVVFWLGKCYTANSQARQYKVIQHCEFDQNKKLKCIATIGAVSATESFVHVRLFGKPATFDVKKVSKVKGQMIYELKGNKYSGFFVINSEQTAGRLEVTIVTDSVIYIYVAVLIFEKNEV
jgi:hypothetical protein